MAIDEAKRIRETVTSAQPEATIARRGPALMATPATARPSRSAPRSRPIGSSSRTRSTASARRSPSPGLALQLQRHQKQVLIGAAVAGFVLGGGIAGVTGIFRRRR